MKIKVLLENTAKNDDFVSEHGLSLYIETNGYKILFDAGQSGIFAENAKKLAVNLADVDFFVLSHGHYDHGGGLPRFQEINKKAPIYMNEHAFEGHYHGSEKYIGLSDKIDKERVIFVSDELKISENIRLYSCNSREKKYFFDSFGLSVCRNNELCPEDFVHEQYLMIEEKGKKILISGCSHKGILNIMDWFSPDVLVGGFHFSKLDVNGDGRKVLEDASKQLLSYDTEYYTCHCTGTAQYEFMKDIMGERLYYIRTGDEFEI